MSISPWTTGFNSMEKIENKGRARAFNIMK